jgi:glycerophosphoryl diester phosphodiesterase
VISETVNIEINTVALNDKVLSKDSWLVVMHANRIPPHVGVLINGNYNSLTIKGHELNVTIEALLKTISQKKIESVFIKLKKHPVFSLDHQTEMFKETIKKFGPVRQHEATCLSPIKLFFEEFYAVQLIETELYYDLMKRLNDNSYLEFAGALNFEMPKDTMELPFYTLDELNETIKAQRLPYYKD